jgi:5-methyltetrahydrofolate--homocysteine methyltransferase
MGDPLQKCIQELESENVDVIGANCTLGSEDMLDLAKQAIEITEYPISIKPNAGKPRIVGMETFYDQPVKDFVKDIQEMINLGVKVVGGCCGTSPETIQEIYKIIKSV